MNSTLFWTAASALSTTLAALAAIAFGVWAEIRLRTERRERNEERLQRAARDDWTKDREQAIRVSAWYQDSDSELAMPDVPRRQIVVSNASDRPIYTVMVGPAVPLGVLPPVTNHAFNIDPNISLDAYAALPSSPATIRFRDGAGLAWQRDHEGRLKQFEGEGWDQPPP